MLLQRITHSVAQGTISCIYNFYLNENVTMDYQFVLGKIFSTICFKIHTAYKFTRSDRELKRIQCKESIILELKDIDAQRCFFLTQSSLSHRFYIRISILSWRDWGGMVFHIPGECGFSLIIKAIIRFLQSKSIQWRRACCKPQYVRYWHILWRLFAKTDT